MSSLLNVLALVIMFVFAVLWFVGGVTTHSVGDIAAGVVITIIGIAFLMLIRAPGRRRGRKYFTGDKATPSLEYLVRIGAIKDYDNVLADQLRMGKVEKRSTSPGGRYIVCVDGWDPHIGHWVETPELYDTAANHALLGLRDRKWHLDSADWPSESVVVMRLDHYPGSVPYDVVIDCQRLTVSVGGRTVPLEEVEDALKRSLPGGR
jgi:hypothetical protein